MHGTRTPLQLWFWAAYLVATPHPGISAVQLQHQLRIRRYETAWLVLHKLRRAIASLDEYVFRHNRRRTPMAAFQTLLGLGAQHQPTIYSQITRHAA